MTREQALETAKQNLQAYSAAMIAFDFKGAARPVDADFGYKHGWFSVGEYSFNREDLTGEKWDVNQGGWAYL